MIITGIMLRIKKYREEYDLKKTTLMKTTLMKTPLMKITLIKMTLIKITLIKMTLIKITLIKAPLMKCYKKINLIKKLIYLYLRHNRNNKDLFEFI